jgi:SNF2 family DNA or RNA helicase
MERLSRSLFDSKVDLNPHQIEAALFALRSPLSKGVLLADEVGLGKTIEAGIVLCQYWAERKRKLMIICPASIRKQWALELQEKFHLPAIVLDQAGYSAQKKAGQANPFDQKAIILTSFNFAAKMQLELRPIQWDLIVIDEAHKLRNAYKESNKIGQAIRWFTEDRKKLLLTATPLQNSLLELFGLSTLIDANFFGETSSFRAKYMNAGANLTELKDRIKTFCKRNLRAQVSEYVNYTHRKAITRPFEPTDDEHKLYEAISEFLKREETYALPKKQRHLTVLILRKLLASSSSAIAGTLDTMLNRLTDLQKGKPPKKELRYEIEQNEEIDEDILDELFAEADAQPEAVANAQIDWSKLNEEIVLLKRLSDWAKGVGVDTKTKNLLKAIEIGFERMRQTGAAEKALIFTESRRTQDYLKRFLESNGFDGRIVIFNGTNSGDDAARIYKDWLAKNEPLGRSSGSRSIDARTALVEYFRDNAAIMIATEAAAEGVNLQFCSLVVNYDLPWNPQRIEQRIGRCHRYGQKHDVVVINFLNERNDVDKRVYELLNDKFNLFDGLFGSSDEVLGTIESGVDFEKRILAIYQTCRTPKEIESAFKSLQLELEEQIKTRLDETRKTLFEHFDADVHERLKDCLESARYQLDLVSRQFWIVTTWILKDDANFREEELTFDLKADLSTEVKAGRYFMLSQTRKSKTESLNDVPDSYFLYRFSHPLGEYVLDKGKKEDTPPAHIAFDLSNAATLISALEPIKHKSGYLTLSLLTIDSFETEEYLLFSGFTDQGESLDQEILQRLFSCPVSSSVTCIIPDEINHRLQAENAQHTKAMINSALEANNKHFAEARDKLERWADDMVYAAEKTLKDTKDRIKDAKRRERQATSLEAQMTIQEEIRTLEKQQRKQREEIFKVEDEICDKRDHLIDGLQKRLSQKTSSTHIFTIRWAVV